MKKNAVHDQILALGKNLSKQKKGALFVIAPKSTFKGKYELLYPQVSSKVKINSKGFDEVIYKLAELDGAFLVSNTGELIAFGARIKKSKTIQGKGTKHAAASGITSRIKKSTAILISEENGWIKVFKNGNIILETDGKDTTPNITKKVIDFITDNDTALITAAGASAAVVGVVPIVIVGGTYLALKTASGIIRKNLQE